MIPQVHVTDRSDHRLVLKFFVHYSNFTKAIDTVCGSNASGSPEVVGLLLSRHPLDVVIVAELSEKGWIIEG